MHNTQSEQLTVVSCDPESTTTHINDLTLKIVIIGASHAGVNVAFNLRQQGWLGIIILIDSDPQLPYHRPPLSKKTLQSDEVIATPLKQHQAYIDNNIDLCLGVTVESINSQSKLVLLANGSQITYDKLVIATGGSAFIPPIDGLADTVDEEGNPQYFAMRTHADAVAIKAALNKSKDKQVVIIGGGYIGLESASSFIALGANVTVIEMQPKILSRVTSPVMSDFLTALHINKGVALQTNKSVIKIKHQVSNHQVSKHPTTKHIVECSDGSQYPADFILVGVGVRLNTQLAINTGLVVEQGIKVNDACQTSDPDIFALGDCTQHFSPLYQRWIRLESVQNAVDQAKAASQFLTSQHHLAAAVPWFWSDQYEYKLQIVGLSDGFDDLVVRQESPEQFSVWYFKNDKLLCVEAVNYTKVYVLGTQAIKQQLIVNKTILKDTSIELNKLTLLSV
ncbi:NAD(P)/FAD-dependent oxidoreductase [Shewanella frigidimarina]|uniref:Pyridine nucleotide-disulfide oxidoreductase n=1 Tax=Shewanella frigidimarina TaxID=56812 RepID=A0A106BZ37_SHEFR|nr:FAD-dependent oxidoreductase [Shewanella frigidimarina]KVX01278.1 pyridine nucleotide-disulfide oxidoreductase [Shewanella frigidimarina]